jgi:hypothetical protein
MSADVKKLHDDLRQVALEKRTRVFDAATKPANLPDVLSSLDKTLRVLTERLAMPAATTATSSGPAEFVVTERDDAGKIKSFREGEVEFIVTERDVEGRVQSFKIGRN